MGEFTQTDFTRQERLSLWLKRAGITQREIGEKISLSQGCVSLYLNRDKIPSERLKQLIELGIPSDLLPQPMDIRPELVKKHIFK